MNRIRVSVVVPMYNESANLPESLIKIAEELQKSNSFQIIAVDDGSKDDSLQKLNDLQSRVDWLRVISYAPNQGRGYAIREGFKAARGEIVCTIDADLSYTPDHLTRMIELLDRFPKLDCVVGSPYVEGGSTENVPWLRLLISKWGNRVISRAMGRRIRTATGVLRAYRASCIKSLELFSNGKELHLEILAKLLAAGYSVLEMPATLRSRKKGKSKFNFRAIASSHLLFSLHEKPMLLFGLIGMGLIFLGFCGGGYLIYLWQNAILNPTRPLMTLVMLLVLTGIQILMFGFLGSGLVKLRKEIFVVQRENKMLEMKLEQWKDSLAANQERTEQVESDVVVKSGDSEHPPQTEEVAHRHQSSAGLGR